MTRCTLATFLAILVLFVLTGCVSSLGDRKITDKDLLSQIKLGVSTRENVRSLFGDPQGKHNRQPFQRQLSQEMVELAGLADELGSDCLESWMYMYSEHKSDPIRHLPIPLINLLAEDSRESEMYSFHFCFDKNGILQSLTESHTAGKGRESGRKIDSSLWNMIVEGKTTEAEVMELLGKPQSKRMDAKGTRSYTYTYHKTTETGGGLFLGPNIESYHDMYSIEFNRAGVVSSLFVHKSGPGGSPQK